ncbi:WD repeat-containing protein DWA2-like [Apium graveolens]|uniref:WD repeat-containing protein DWA2-like n=1 Tax=Apium graveolens TaxID=4045 RepID=UPI003D7A9996
MIKIIDFCSISTSAYLSLSARCIADVKADTDHTSFITGTLSLSKRRMRLSSSGTALVCEGLFSHPNEIWDLASCPFDQPSGSWKETLWIFFFRL